MTQFVADEVQVAQLALQGLQVVPEEKYPVDPPQVVQVVPVVVFMKLLAGQLKQWVAVPEQVAQLGSQGTQLVPVALTKYPVATPQVVQVLPVVEFM